MAPTEKKVRKTLYGGYSENTCAYCAYHNKALTVNQVKKHKCLGKQCSALIRHEHPYWEARERTKQNRQERKQRLEAAYAASVRR